MIKFNTTLRRFEKKGEKTGWTYFEISAAQANKLKPGTAVSFRVKGTLDSYAFSKVAILPMGDGGFIMPFNAAMRKATGKKHGDKITVTLEADDSKLKLSADMLACLKEDPEAEKYFKSLPPSHQQYFSKWIESAKTAQTKTRRIVACMSAFSKKLTYGELIRSYRAQDF